MFGFVLENEILKIKAKDITVDTMDLSEKDLEWINIAVSYSDSLSEFVSYLNGEVNTQSLRCQF